MFQDRTDAGRRLADALAPLIAGPIVVAAIPRGGVTVALPVAERFGAPLTVVYARKLTAPVAPELALGSLDEDGQSIVDAATVAMLGLTHADVEAAKARVAVEIRRRMALYEVPPLARYLPGAGVVLVDDGLATGLTMRAALAYARRHGAREVTVAVPCAATGAAQHFEREADRFVSLIVDPDFYAVGAYYRDFSPVADAEVVALLARAPKAPAPAPSAPLAARQRSVGAIGFRNPRGRRLAGKLLLPAGAGRYPAVAVAHGWGSGKDSPWNLAMAEALRQAGIAVLLFDFTGHGESEGSAEESTLAQQTEDLGAALDALAGHPDVDADRLGVAGASSGAAAALEVAAARPDLKAVVLRSANPEGAEPAAARVRAPTLLVVGEEDAPTREVNETLLKRLAAPHRLEVVPGGDHLFGDPAALKRAVDLGVAWFRQHLA